MRRLAAWAVLSMAAICGPVIRSAEPIRDPFEGAYKDYKPDYLSHATHEGSYGKAPSQEEMKLSSEAKFYTLNLINESSRAYALVEAARQKESENQYREALEIYQKVIDEYPEVLYRVSEHGIFVPVTQYCQLRMLRFPREHLQLYRVKYDSRAREAFELARQKNSLEGLAEIRDKMLCTSYGAPAMLALGDVALDRGHYLEALEYFTTVRDFFPDKSVHTPELQLKLAYCQKMLGGAAPGGQPASAPSALDPSQLKQFNAFVAGARPDRPALFAQQASAPNTAADDYMLMPPTLDPIGLTNPVWSAEMEGARQDYYVYSQPVVTRNNVVYRHKNIIYCHSLLNGELRWKNDLGGVVKWQNWRERQYQQEDVLCQDGLVFTPVFKVGPTLLALDETTGRLKWAYGPMVATSREEANMRFETAPAGGPMTVFAGYVLDNVEGETHTDTEYGVMAFDSTTGRIRWRRAVCSLRPGQFSAGFAETRRNKIRSFFSPPLYHEGTVYYCTNAGVIVALDALSGRIKWAMRYPYYLWPNNVHDSTRPFGGGGETVKYTSLYAYPHHPMFWYGQRPLIVGDDIYVMPVDAKFMFKLDRRTGTVTWTSPRGVLDDRGRQNAGGSGYFLGLTKAGDLMMVYSWRGSCVVMLDAKTGKVKRALEDPVALEKQPTVKYFYGRTSTSDPVYFLCLGADRANYQTSARPFMTTDNKLYVPSFSYWGYPIFGWGANLAVYSLDDGRLLQRRRFFTGELQMTCANAIAKAPVMLKTLEDVPHKNEPILKEMAMLKEIIADTIPENEFGPFMPFARVTTERYGTRFELRMAPRQVSMVYDRETVKRTVSAGKDPESLFAQAELAVAESRLADAAGLLNRCLDAMSSEDLDFRVLVNQLLYKVHRELARSGVRTRQAAQELEQCIGMSRTVTSLADELETMFALADAYQRRGDAVTAGRQLQSVVSTYGAYEHPTPSVLSGDLLMLMGTSTDILKRGQKFVSGSSYSGPIEESLARLETALPMYFSAISPLKRDLVVRAGELAAARLLQLQKAAPDFAAALDRQARQAMADKPMEEQLSRLAEFPGTPTAQKVLEQLLAAARAAQQKQGASLAETADLRKRQWALADAARIGGLKLPAGAAVQLLAPPALPAPVPIVAPLKNMEKSLEEERGTAWLVMQRAGDPVRPELVFLGGRVKKKFDNKFVLYAVDSRTGEVAWKASEKRGDLESEEIRLAGKGDEAGFSEAFVRGDLVVVHGLFDVLAFGLADGKLKWRYAAPFDFEIVQALMSGDILVLMGASESIGLYIPTADPRGEMIWQEKDEGDIYAAPYFHGDRIVSVRKLPFNVTVRYRSTGRLMGRLSTPELSLLDEHPLLEDGQPGLPVAHDGRLLVVSDGYYYVAIDVERMKIAWKRFIDENDVTRVPPIRFEVNGDYLAVVKRNYDVKTIYMLSSRTGAVLWRTDPKDARSPEPIDSMLIRDGILYGIKPHPGQGFFVVGLDCRTGKSMFAPNEQKGYGGKPDVGLWRDIMGDTLVTQVRDRQDFELKAFDRKTGKLLHTVKAKAAGNFGEHGRASATVQNGSIVLLGKNDLVIGKKE